MGATGTLRAVRGSDRARAELLPRSLAGGRERGARPRARNAGPESSPPLIRLLAIVGPTGTGKSGLAVEIARRIGGEIVGCDALQVYRGLDSATAKPGPVERREIRHHLIDAVDPRHAFSLAEFVARAERAIAEIVARGHVPIVVGGTGLYLRGLLRGIVALPPRDALLRARLRAVAERRGTGFLHRWLARVDPDSAARLAAGDSQRILRALELGLSTSRTWSARLRDEGSFRSGAERYRTVKVGLRLDRQALARRLDARVGQFFEAGLVEEVRALLAAGVPAEANALKAIGYREVVRALRAGADPTAVAAEVQRSTRRYAKRQLTWFRREPGLLWLDAGEDRARLVERVLELWNGQAQPEATV